MTSNNEHIDTSSLRLAERIVAILSEGRFTATYKYAVLIGLMDLCMQCCQKSGAAPTTITTWQLAERIVELYWPHSQVFDRMDNSRVLWQNAAPQGSQASIITKILQFRNNNAPDPSSTLYRSSQSAPDSYKKLVQATEWILIRYPLPRLQFMGKTETRFLYEIDWNRQDTDQNAGDLKRRVTEYQRGNSDVFDNRITLKGGVGDLLIRISGLLRPLIHNQWADKVAHINQLDRIQLEHFLFGSPRIDTRILCEGLLEIQNGECMYCKKHISNIKSAHVDHFVPRSRYASDDLANLVLAHQKCNLAKTNYLAAAVHLENWIGRLGNTNELRQVASAAKWELNTTRVLGTTRAIYSNLPDEVPLWLNGQSFIPAVQTEIAKALATT